MKGKIILTAAAIGFISLIIFMYLSISTVFIGLLLGMLTIPTVLVFASILKEGAPIISKEIKNLIHSRKVFIVISLSKENIILQPELT